MDLKTIKDLYLLSRSLFISIFVASIGIIILSLIPAFVVQSIIDRVVINRTFETLYVLVGVLFISAFFEAIFLFIRGYFTSYLSCKYAHVLSAKTIYHVYRLPLMYFYKAEGGDISQRLLDVNEIRDNIVDINFMVITGLLSIFASIILLLTINMGMALLALILLLLNGFVFYFMSILMKKKWTASKVAAGKFNNLVNQLVKSMEVIRSFGMSMICTKLTGRVMNENLWTGFEANAHNSMVVSLSRIFSKLTEAGIIFTGIRLVMLGSITLGEFVFCQMMFVRMLEPLNRFSMFLGRKQRLSTILERLNAINDLPIEEENSNLLAVAENRGAPLLKFDKVSFYYPDTTESAIRDVSFSINKGECVFLLGPSGSGKSTVSRLMGGLLHHWQGKLLFNNDEIDTQSILQLRKKVAVVFQETELFPGTIRENINCFNVNENACTAEQAAIEMEADEFIIKLPKKYQTPVSANNTYLSGGQKQRIGLSRLYAKQADIWIVDEGTSALDYELENKIISNLTSKRQDKTVIIVTHRIENCVLGDRVLGFDSGKIVFNGKPNAYLEFIKNRKICYLENSNAQ